MTAIARHNLRVWAACCRAIAARVRSDRLTPAETFSLMRRLFHSLAGPVELPADMYEALRGAGKLPVDDPEQLADWLDAESATSTKQANEG